MEAIVIFIGTSSDTNSAKKGAHGLDALTHLTL